MEHLKHGLYERNTIIFAVLMLFCMICVWLVPEEVSAFSYTKMPSGTGTPTGKKIVLKAANAQITYSGGYTEKTAADGTSKLLYIKNNKAAKNTYNNFCTVVYPNAGKIAGRSFDVKVEFTKMVVNKPYSTSGIPSDGYLCFAKLTGNNITVSQPNQYPAKKVITTRMTITWADNGSVVNLPFYQGIHDIDAGNTSYQEAWEGVSGYKNTCYIWPQNNCTLSGNKITSHNPPILTDGNDSWYKNGAIAPTNNGQFTCRWDEGSSGTSLYLYSEYIDIKNPEKAANKEAARPGDTITYTVKRLMQTYYRDAFNPYNSMVFEDTLPKGVTYQSAVLYNGAGANITSSGTLAYDETTRKVTFTMGSAWLNSIGNYNGQTLQFKIDVTADKPDAPSETVDNMAITNISGLSYVTGKTTTTVYNPYYAHYEYVSGTKGYKLPSAISTQTGEFAVKDDTVYKTGETVKRVSDPAGGAQYKIMKDGKEVGIWTLTWDAEAKKITDSNVTFTGTWVYRAAPEITIEKKVKRSDLYGYHGDATFLFQTINDAGDTWYRAISFTRDVVTALLQNGGTYEDQENGTKFSVDENFITGSTAFQVPEGNYNVSELPTLRYQQSSVTARYVKDGKAIPTTGKSAAVPLKISTYEKGDDGYDMDGALVTFQNTKVKWQKYSHNDYVLNQLAKAR